jgi:hypothetical protein
MADLKTFWDNPATSSTDLGGDGVTQRGSDPNSEGDNGKEQGITPIWDAAKRATNDNSIAESPNSVSKLPPLPTRYQPNVPSSMEPPNLTTRSPQNVDKQ